MKLKKNTSGTEAIPIKKTKKQRSFEDQVVLFTTYFKNPDEFSKIFIEHGFSYLKDGCSGNCIPCKKKSCETYRKIMKCFKN